MQLQLQLLYKRWRAAKATTTMPPLQLLYKRWRAAAATTTVASSSSGSDYPGFADLKSTCGPSLGPCGLVFDSLVPKSELSEPRTDLKLSGPKARAIWDRFLQLYFGLWTPDRSKTGPEGRVTVRKHYYSAVPVSQTQESQTQREAARRAKDREAQQASYPPERRNRHVRGARGQAAQELESSSHSPSLLGRGALGFGLVEVCRFFRDSFGLAF